MRKIYATDEWHGVVTTKYYIYRECRNERVFNTLNAMDDYQHISIPLSD